MVKTFLAAVCLFAVPSFGARWAQPATVPASAVVLARARQAQIPLPELAQAVRAASGVAESVQALETLGLLKAGEVNAGDPGQALAMRHVLQAVWREAGPTASAAEIDASWALPAVVVRAPGTVYYLHGASHGLTGGLAGKAARRLEKQVRLKGEGPLLVEQSLPAAFRLKAAQEVVDRPAERVSPSVTLWLARLMPLGRRFHRLYFNALSRLAARQGNQDLSGHFKAVADRVYAKEADPAAVMFLDLPLALKQAVEPELVARSRAIFAAAAGRSGGAVHVLSGWSHVPDLAALLGPKDGA